MVLLSGTAAAGALAAPAQAATIGRASVDFSSDGRRVVFVAGSGTTNKIVVTRSGNTITLDDRAAVKAGPGCTAVKGDKTKVRCTDPKSITRVRVELGSGNDEVVNRTSVALSAFGGGGNDELTGGSGRDKLYGGTGRDRLSGGGGVDALYGGDSDDVLTGNAGNDYLDGGKGRDREYGGSGNDRFGQPDRGKAEDADLVAGGAGFDTVTYSGKRGITADSDRGTRDDGRKGEGDTLTGVEGIHGGDGNDRIHGDNGPNLLVGGGGDDILLGYGGNDWLRDYGSGNDRLDGGAGDDRLEAGTGADVITGGAGSDTVDYLGHRGPVTVDLDGAKGDDGVRGEKDTVGADVENIIGTEYGDTLTGNGSANRIEGAVGDDVIRGGAGNDVLLGGDGLDRILGEAGDDNLSGSYAPGHTADGHVDVLDGGDGNDNAATSDDTSVITEYSTPFTIPVFNENFYFGA